MFNFNNIHTLTEEEALDDMNFYDTFIEAKKANECSYDIKLARAVWDATRPDLRVPWMFLGWRAYDNPHAAYVIEYGEDPGSFDREQLYADLCYSGLDVILATDGRVLVTD